MLTTHSQFQAVLTDGTETEHLLALISKCVSQDPISCFDSIVLRTLVNLYQGSTSTSDFILREIFETYETKAGFSLASSLLSWGNRDSSNPLSDLKSTVEYDKGFMVGLVVASAKMHLEPRTVMESGAIGVLVRGLSHSDIKIRHSCRFALGVISKYFKACF